jgi:5-hydroxyisourate hydrolase-like protein (transthyretin family)
VKRISLIFALVVSLPLLLTAHGKEKKPMAQIDFTVLRESNGKPVRRASVILHAVHKDGKQDKDAYEVKTDAEGKVTLSDLDYGKYRIQVIAEHLQTYGDDLEVTEPTKQMTIKLKAPQSQYSIY